MNKVEKRNYERFGLLMECGIAASEHRNMYDGKWNQGWSKYTIKMKPGYTSHTSCVDILTEENRGGPPNRWQDASQVRLNYLKVKNKWYFFAARYAPWAFKIVDVQEGFAVMTPIDVTWPRCTEIRAHGDMYRFALEHNVLDRLKVVVGKKTFKSIQSRMIQRTLGKKSNE